ncbi:phosphatidylinositol N-acetylglucosaminyltransferase subunit P [Trichonephila inaurata madagascariensis]|uniref:Phosphatidylinositol N-acetylglucosaminyltransferase subunit P n=1 Tax=Trichonephila inaurata madagascariensis TaxID=2747483 RepID=A0A8X6WZD6_9ARAC|nr:phosphatidylinositol N-acetylglucosaminyltransferase subunit P [Trichonephila inaurata madagascariensis]
MSEHSPAPTSTRSVYGFVLYITNYTLLLIYLIWAYIPTPWLHALGLTYWPQKYWAVAIPVYICCCILIFALLLYPGINLMMTPDLSSIQTITDEHARIPKPAVRGSIPPIYDIPISEVCHKLYLKKNLRMNKITLRMLFKYYACSLKGIFLHKMGYIV